MNKIFRHFYKLCIAISILFVFVLSDSKNIVEAQDIPELHMVIFQGDVIIGTGNQKTSSLDGLVMDAKISDQIVGSVKIGENLTGRFSGLEIGPNLTLEGEKISFWIGNEKALEESIFGPLTPSGEYCPGCTWSLPISRSLNLHFNQVPLPTPTPAPAPVLPSFLTGSLIFGSVLSAPEGVKDILAYVGDEIIGVGEVSGPSFSITVDPGNENYLGKEVIFKIEGYESKTKYIFQEDEFKTDVKLFFPQYVPPTSTPTPSQPEIPTSTPEPTRTPTPVPEPTPTYTPTPTPTPIGLSVSGSNNDLVLADSNDGGCNSRGGGPASVSLILLSLVPAYVLKRKSRKI